MKIGEGERSRKRYFPSYQSLHTKKCYSEREQAICRSMDGSFVKNTKPLTSAYPKGIGFPHFASGQKMLLLRDPASRWRNAVHAQEDHQLSVVIVGVFHGKGREIKPWGFALAERHLLQHILAGQRGGGLVTKRERVFQILDDVGF